MRLTMACACDDGDFTIDCCRLRTSGGVRGADIEAIRHGQHGAPGAVGTAPRLQAHRGSFTTTPEVLL